MLRWHLIVWSCLLQISYHGLANPLTQERPIIHLSWAAKRPKNNYYLSLTRSGLISTLTTRLYNVKSLIDPRTMPFQFDPSPGALIPNFERGGAFNLISLWTRAVSPRLLSSTSRNGQTTFLIDHLICPSLSGAENGRATLPDKTFHGCQQ